MSKLRGYKESYLKFGFADIGGKPQCVLCGEVLAQSCMVPTKLARHLRTKHPSFQDKDIEFFETKKRKLESQKLDNPNKDVVGALIGNEHVKKLDKIPCSNDTVARRIKEMASDVQDPVIEKLKSAGKFSRAMDESCDVSGSPQLVAFVRFVGGLVIAEELLCCLELETRHNKRSRHFQCH
ncbi:zinc finger BED domain-containing protein 5-like [Ixodes scapularis]|uniref:zinc finger BED domain-containing protein 5-like n=1 Tax=Ixodes scapularis TaxID=6945 RepID=UPI001A9D16B6|nr:zinc finger BED domain-containing protein 5-like [Ixodes scapularis]